MDMRKKHELRQAAQVKTPEEKLQEEVSKTPRSFTVFVSCNEALQVFLKIGKEEYGIDLLKKLALSSRQPPTQTPEQSLWGLSGLFWQDAREKITC